MTAAKVLVDPEDDRRPSARKRESSMSSQARTEVSSLESNQGHVFFASDLKSKHTSDERPSQLVEYSVDFSALE